MMWWSGNQVLPSEGKPEFPKKEIHIYEGLCTIRHLAPSDMKAICRTFTNE
jgi:hypothetical protein